MGSDINLISETQNALCTLTLNRIEKHNAFDADLIGTLQVEIDKAINNPEVRVILLKANGPHFSAGADLNWMQQMASFSEDENRQDALQLANLLLTLHQSPKPTLVRVQGSAFGGGAGLIAACDIAFASNKANFCFSEVSLGLIPAVISPYVINAIGKKAANWLFISAEMIDALQAKHLGLVQHCLDEENLDTFISNYIKKMMYLAPQAVSECKTLVGEVAKYSIDNEVNQYTASRLAKKRVSAEGQLGLKAFLNKEKPTWK